MDLLSYHEMESGYCFEGLATSVSALKVILAQLNCY